MATAQEYAEWIVSNKAKRGTPEFDTVVNAYEIAKQSENAQAMPFEAHAQPEQSTSLADKAMGALEVGATVATGATTGALGAIGGAVGGLAQQILSGNFGTPEAVRAVEQAAARGAESGTYMPRTQTGKETIGAIGNVLQGIPPVVPVIGPIGAVSRAAATAAPLAQATAQRAIQSAAPVVKGAAKTVAAIPSKVEGAIIGKTDLPETPIAPARVSGGAAATPLETQRAAEAEMAGLRLTEGEIKRSPELLAWEKEKAKTPEYQAPFVERQQENNRAALRKLDTMIDDTGTETGTPTDTGIKVVDTLMKGWDEEKRKTRALYDAFAVSPESQLPVDHTSVISFLNEQPVGVSGITGVTDTARQNAVRLGVAALADDGTLVPTPSTLGQLEAFRQSVSAIGTASRNDKRLVETLKRQIDNAGDPVGGQLTRSMRAQRQRQAQKYENRAIVSRLLLKKKGMDDQQVPVEDVFNKTILSSRPSEIQHLRRVLFTIGGDDGRQVWKDLQGETLRYIQESAVSGIGADNLPVISAAKLDKVVKNLDKNGKLNLVLGNQGAEQVRNLNQVLQYIQTAPPMTSINNSGTARTVMALLAESGIAGATVGIPVPVVQGMKMLRDNVKDKRIKARITASLNYKPQRD